FDEPAFRKRDAYSCRLADDAVARLLALCLAVSAATFRRLPRASTPRPSAQRRGRPPISSPTYVKERRNNTSSPRAASSFWVPSARHLRPFASSAPWDAPAWPKLEQSHWPGASPKRPRRAPKMDATLK